ncbi:MSHA biogenesis protein MshP [Vibrio profundi]|uniref:MSHA biogenesis protein MshP n=1 Tax=Vibrio profundi TaxID=1774960 RepID=UPI00373634F8
MSHNFCPRKRTRQRGSLYIVAIFVLVVMGMLSMSLTRVEWSNSDAQTREFLGTQAWLAAHSANEWALTQVYPLVAGYDEDACADTVDGASLDFNLAQCQNAELTCEELPVLDDTRSFRIEATVECGSGINQVQRVQEVWVRE